MISTCSSKFNFNIEILRIFLNIVWGIGRAIEICIVITHFIVLTILPIYELNSSRVIVPLNVPFTMCNKLSSSSFVADFTNAWYYAHNRNSVFLLTSTIIMSVRLPLPLLHKENLRLREVSERIGHIAGASARTQSSCYFQMLWEYT